MFGRIDKIYKGDQLEKEAHIMRQSKDLHDLTSFMDNIYFEAFTPSAKLAEDVNKALRNGHPLLITGERYLRELPGRSIAYEINQKTYECFMHFFFVWKIKKGEKFHDSIYTFDHEAKKRDLEYHRLSPEQNPLRENSFYFKPGPILRLLEIRKNDPTRDKKDPLSALVLSEVPIIEIQDVHNADPDFIVDLLEFLNTTKDVFIPELDKKYTAEATMKPLFIMTAEENFKLPNNYEGVIYSHNMEFPEKEELVSTLVGHYKTYENPKTHVYFTEGFMKKVSQIIETMVDLFILAKDNCFLRPDDEEFPLTIPQLKDSINVKVHQAAMDESKVNGIIKELSKSLKVQMQVHQNMNIDEAIASIKKHIENSKLKKAFRSLKLIQNNLPKQKKKEISQLISIYNDLAVKERMATESELILYPMRNKLKFDLLTILDELNVGLDAGNPGDY